MQGVSPETWPDEGGKETRLQHALRLRSRRLAGRCALPPASMSLGGVSVRPAVGPGHRDCDLACLFRWQGGALLSRRVSAAFQSCLLCFVVVL
eukprot:3590842-Pyramimonas_sp.AAC.1